MFLKKIFLHAQIQRSLNITMTLTSGQETTEFEATGKSSKSNQSGCLKPKFTESQSATTQHTGGFNKGSNIQSHALASSWGIFPLNDFTSAHRRWYKPGVGASLWSGRTTFPEFGLFLFFSEVTHSLTHSPLTPANTQACDARTEETWGSTRDVLIRMINSV